jgi:hypothetical protein
VGDIVMCDIRGSRFYAEVTEKGKGNIAIKPLTKGYGFYSANSRQVVGLWRKSKASRV